MVPQTSMMLSKRSFTLTSIQGLDIFVISVYKVTTITTRWRDSTGEVRDREKVMRGLKNADTPILKGYQIYHNYMRPHEGLKNKTPA